MTTSRLVGPESQSSQDHSSTFTDSGLLIGATERTSAYSRLKRWLRLPAAEAEAAAQNFRAAVASLPAAEQAMVIEAENDALRHGFSFVDFQKLRNYALRAIEDPFVSVDADAENSPYLIASTMALYNN